MSQHETTPGSQPDTAPGGTANGGVNYGMTPAQVIAAVQAAIDNGTYDALATKFEGMNERGCTIN